VYPTQVVLKRNRRQFEGLNRLNFARTIRTIIASGDMDVCMAACTAYIDNERAAASANPLRGPNRRTQFLRSGGTSFARRFNRLFDLQSVICLGLFCGSIPSMCENTHMSACMLLKMRCFCNTPGRNIASVTMAVGMCFHGNIATILLFWDVTMKSLFNSIISVHG
jgi:hypothetical protein